jgi:hypothetical protein
VDAEIDRRKGARVTRKPRRDIANVNNDGHGVAN